MNANSCVIPEMSLRRDTRGGHCSGRSARGIDTHILQGEDLRVQSGLRYSHLWMRPDDDPETAGDLLTNPTPNDSNMLRGPQLGAISTTGAPDGSGRSRATRSSSSVIGTPVSKSCLAGDPRIASMRRTFFFRISPQRSMEFEVIVSVRPDVARLSQCVLKVHVVPDPTGPTESHHVELWGRRHQQRGLEVVKVCVAKHPRGNRSIRRTNRQRRVRVVRSYMAKKVGRIPFATRWLSTGRNVIS